MYVRNLLNSGDYVIPVPEGILITLQYDSTGKLQKIYQGYHEHLRTNITDALLTPFYDSRIVPTTIPLHGGTTWVTGVLYTPTSCWEAGSLPECIVNQLKTQFIADHSQFTFYAGTASSLAASFQGRPSIHTWLQIAKFTTMYGFIVPYKFNRTTLSQIIKSAKAPYSLNKIVSYLIFRGGEVLCQSSKEQQFVISKVSKYLEPDGRIMAKIYGKTDDALVVNYSDVVRYNLQTNTGVVLDEDNHVVCTAVTDNKHRDKRGSTLTCSCCGAIIEVPETGDTICSNEHCVSRLYPRLEQFLDTLRMPIISYETFWKYVSNNMITNLSDIFLVPEYVNFNISVTWSKLLTAVVPFEVVPNPAIFTTFTSKCKNTFKTVMYYLHNPSLIAGELRMTDPISTKFAKWLTEGGNVLDIEAIIDCPNITLTATNRAFDGAPIFRNQVIYITGTFTHGPLDIIESILRSYGADVMYELSDSVTWVLVGDEPENVNSGAVRKAKNRRIPVFTESKFFEEFEIDSDLVAVGVENL